MSRQTQTMKPATAAKKLGVLLDATPAEFQEGVVSREELDALQADPPEWLRDLRRDGPHPRPVVADRLGVSISGLARAEITEPLTTAQIAAIKSEQPEWLRNERNLRAETQREEARLKAEKAGQAERPRRTKA
jgi:broad specificity phosphatase PhoE